ncbi:Hypothetical protein EIN_046700, partial [Entamoeba invadens IP1]
ERDVTQTVKSMLECVDKCPIHTSCAVLEILLCYKGCGEIELDIPSVVTQQVFDQLQKYIEIETVSILIETLHILLEMCKKEKFEEQADNDAEDLEGGIAQTVRIF